MAPQGYGDLRRWAYSWLAAHPVAGVEPDDVALVITELVSNSIKYGAGPVLVDLATDDQLLRLDVGDCSEEIPRQPTPGSTASGGRGLLLVSGLSTGWGVRLRPQGGKTVWCTFSGSRRAPTSGEPDLGQLVLPDREVALTCTW
jgi:signal transduction histidine kinase